MASTVFVGRNERSELRRMQESIGRIRRFAPNRPYMKEVGVGVAFDVGTRSRRRASQPKAGLAARSAVRAGSANRHAAQGCAVMPAPPSARSAGVFGGSGACFLLVTLLCTSKEE